MTSPRWAHAATELLAEERFEARPPSEEERARAIAAIEHAIRVEARARRRRAAAGALALAAGVALSIFGAIRLGKHPVAAAVPAPVHPPASVVATAHAMGGPVIVEHAGARRVVEDAAEVAVGDRVGASPEGRAAVSLSTGTHLVLEPRGELAVVAQSAAQIYALQTGAVRADVAKVPPGGRFVIRRVDAEVEVRGTSFRVALSPSDPTCGGGTRTRVAVSEGVVVVRSLGNEDRVAAGESWPRGCAAAPAPAVVASASSTDGPPRAFASPNPSPSPPASQPPVPASELAAQNDLFATATAAKRRGDPAAAIASYERFLARYPASTLAESATVERMRLLARSDPARGAAAAKSYLARYPGGFARPEAEAFARGQ